MKQISISQILNLPKKSYADYGVRTLPVPTKKAISLKLKLMMKKKKARYCRLRFNNYFRNLIKLICPEEKHREQKCLQAMYKR